VLLPNVKTPIENSIYISAYVQHIHSNGQRQRGDTVESILTNLAPTNNTSHWLHVLTSS